LSISFVLDQKSKAMRESIIYAGIKNKEIDFPLGIVKEFKKGQFVFEEHQGAFKLFKLKEGLLMMGSALGDGIGDGKSSFTHFVQQGEYFGEEVLLGIQQRGNFAQVLSDKVQIEEYSLNLLTDNNVTQKIIRDNFVVHTSRIQHTVLSNARFDLKARLMMMLKLIGAGIGVNLMNGEVLIRTHLKHRELAFLCNATRQSITTQLIELSKSKFVNIDKNSILLTNRLLTNT
jgi:CRP/FNR family cyclic AMP-dependent transcriptional regulator